MYVCLSFYMSVRLCVRLSVLNNRPCGIHPSPRPTARSPIRPPPTHRPSARSAVHPLTRSPPWQPPIQPSDLTKRIPVNPLYPGMWYPSRAHRTDRQLGNGRPTCSASNPRLLTNIYPPPTPHQTWDVKFGCSAANLEAVWPRNYSVFCAAPT